MSNIPKVIGAIVVVIVSVMVGGIESKGITIGLQEMVGSTTTMSASSPIFEGMPAVDFNWSY